jgi:hypothetical protein
MKVFCCAVAVALLVPAAASAAYDPAADTNTLRALSERIDGDNAQGLLSGDRAALLRAELASARTFVANGDPQATAMLADIDRDLAPLDKSLDANEAGRDLLFHTGDKIVLAMRDGVAWQIGEKRNTDVLDVLATGAANPAGVQGTLLAKQPGDAAVTLVDPASGRQLRFRFIIVDAA